MYNGWNHSLKLWYSPIYSPCFLIAAVRLPVISRCGPTSILFQFQCSALGKLVQPLWCLVVKTISEKNATERKKGGRKRTVMNWVLLILTLCSSILEDSGPVVRIKQLSFKHWSKVLKTKEHKQRLITQVLVIHAYVKGNPVHGNFSGCTPLHP